MSTPSNGPGARCKNVLLGSGIEREGTVWCADRAGPPCAKFGTVRCANSGAAGRPALACLAVWGRQPVHKVDTHQGRQDSIQCR